MWLYCKSFNGCVLATDKPSRLTAQWFTSCLYSNNSSWCLSVCSWPAMYTWTTVARLLVACGWQMTAHFLHAWIIFLWFCNNFTSKDSVCLLRVCTQLWEPSANRLPRLLEPLASFPSSWEWGYELKPWNKNFHKLSNLNPPQKPQFEFAVPSSFENLVLSIKNCCLASGISLHGVDKPFQVSHFTKLLNDRQSNSFFLLVVNL